MQRSSQEAKKIHAISLFFPFFSLVFLEILARHDSANFGILPTNCFHCKMKTLLRIVLGLLITVILLSLCDSWLFSNSEYDWLDNLNEPLIDDEPGEFDWNGSVRAKRAEKNYFKDHEEPIVHSQRCDACRIIANKVHIGFELAESKVGIKTHSLDEYEELGKL